ncbi:MAG: LysM peptidoglycan-binding domain-containing protein [Prevotellaceae bacterium]|jgi:LysM repeat protein|nr:LysM peptidoglycan-binding domain-containing protein [Prevotellaceae bacterium]
MKRLLFTWTIILFTAVLAGQNTNYTINKIGGKDYYEYKVEPGEGFYSLSRKFGIDENEIKRINPNAKDGLKAGDILYIPAEYKIKATGAGPSNQTELQTNQQPVQPTQAISFIEHRVKRKETLFGISQHYGVSQDDIKRCNPDLDKKGLKNGMKLQIPYIVTVADESKNKKTHKSTPDSPTNEERSHQVKAKETLFSISRLYNVSVEDIVKQNPGCDQVLYIGQTLRIPTATTASKTQQPPSGGAPERKTAVADQPYTSEQTNSNTAIVPTRRPIRIAFLLPMMLDGKRDLSIDRFVDFYCGALVAVQENKNKGISFEIYAYDTEKSTEKVNEILTKPELKTMNLIIGPAYSNQVQPVAKFAKQHQINTIIPFSSKIPAAALNQYIYQFNPSVNVEVEFVADLFDNKYKRANILFADLPDVTTEDTFTQELKKELTARRRPYSTIGLPEPESTDLDLFLEKGRQNIILFNSTGFNDVSPYLTELERLSPEFNILLFEQYSWQAREHKKNNAIWISPFDPEPDRTLMIPFETTFNKLFERRNNTINPRYDILGYDLTGYFIDIIDNYGTDFPSAITFYRKKGIQSNYKFVKLSGDSGYMNQQLYLSER